MNCEALVLTGEVDGHPSSIPTTISSPFIQCGRWSQERSISILSRFPLVVRVWYQDAKSSFLIKMCQLCTSTHILSRKPPFLYFCFWTWLINDSTIRYFRTSKKNWGGEEIWTILASMICLQSLMVFLKFWGCAQCTKEDHQQAGLEDELATADQIFPFLFWP